jgi:outer membrane protein TolC
LENEPDAVTPVALVEPALPVNTLKTYAKTHHPGVHRLNESLVALGWSRKSIWSDIVPSVTLRAYVGATGPSRDQLIRTDFQGITVTANALQSLGLQIPARLLANKGVMERTVAERAALVRDVETQVTTAYQNSENYLAGIKAAKTGVESATEGARLAIGRYTVGYGTNLEVVDAQAALVNARVRLAQAVFNYNQAQIQLVQALGLVSETTLVQGVPSDKVITHATP